MTNYDFINANKTNLINFLDKYGQFDGSPWMNWFNKKYCKKCDGISITLENGWKSEACYCELHNNKCKYFNELEEAPNNKQIITMWLDEINEREEDMQC